VESCDGALADWNNLWSTSRQDELTRASGAAAGDALPVLKTRLDAWTGAWRDATHGFCRLQPGGSASAACTLRAHAAASDLLQLIHAGSPARLVRAAAAAEALPTSEQCTSSVPSPASAPLAVVKADVRRRLGMFDEADQLLAKPSDDPAQRGYQSLVRGHTAADRGDLMEARRLFETATFEAAAAQQLELGVTAAVERLALSCSAAERSLWSGYVAAQIQLGAHTTAQAAYRSALAQSLLCEGKIGEAVTLRQQVAQASRGEGTAAGAGAKLDLARAQIAQGDLAGAEASARDAAAIYTKLYGARHPLAQTARLIVAEASPATTAAAAIDRVVVELGDERSHGAAGGSSGTAARREPDAVRARALLLQGRVAAARGNRGDALRLVQRASQEYEAALGGAHPDLATALTVAGDLLLAAERNAEAEASYRQVVAIFDTLGQSESAQLAHARAGIQLARWGNQPPADASETLQWGLASTGDAVDPGVAGWLSEQLARRAAARGDQTAAIAYYRAAATAWQQSGNHRGVVSALSEGALLAAETHAADAASLLEQALRLTSDPIDPRSGGDSDGSARLQAALGKLLWPAERDRARSLIGAALAELPDGSADAADLRRWLKRHD
jgi:hypothetical protein